METVPVDTSSRPERTLRSVVFPEPEGPMMTSISPRFTSRSIPLRASTCTRPVSYTFRMASAFRMGSPSTGVTTRPPSGPDGDEGRDEQLLSQPVVEEVEHLEPDVVEPVEDREGGRPNRYDS
jgi:hypothetical protein